MYLSSSNQASEMLQEIKIVCTLAKTFLNHPKITVDIVNH